jgi:eukaryotic-like serine/threonine-protein kinase
MEEVRVCRLCGHMASADSIGRCQNCNLYAGLTTVSRTEGERIARRRRRHLARKRLFRVMLACVVLGGLTVWAGGVFYDRSLHPPTATTQISAYIGPHTWAQSRRTPQSRGFTPEPSPWPHQLKWTYRTSQPLLASPAVDAHHVYLTTMDHRTVALDQQTGQPVWVYTHQGPSSSTPAVAGNHVIVATRPGVVTALDRHSGARIWTTDLVHPILADPVVIRGTVYIGVADRKLHALDAATGHRLWAFPTQTWIVASVAYADDRVIVAAQDSRLHIVGAQTGRQRFIYDTGLGRHIVGGAAILGNRAYFSSRQDRVWAIDWQATTYPMERGILFWKTNLYVWGILKEPPVQKGTIWSQRLGGDVIHTLAVAHNRVYVTTTQGQVVAIEAESGAEQWTADVGTDITTAPVVASNDVLIGTETGEVIALDAHSGEKRWTFKVTGEITASPIVAGDTLYVVSREGLLYAVGKPE